MVDQRAEQNEGESIHHFLRFIQQNDARHDPNSGPTAWLSSPTGIIRSGYEVCASTRNQAPCDGTNVHQICILSPWRTSDWTCFWMPHEAAAAGSAVLAHLSHQNDRLIRAKRDGSPVSAVDLSHTAIQNVLAPHGIPIISEEGDLPPYASAPTGHSFGSWTHWMAPSRTSTTGKALPSTWPCAMHRDPSSVSSPIRCPTGFCGHPILNALDGFPHEFERTPAHHTDPPPGHTTSLQVGMGRCRKRPASRILGRWRVSNEQSVVH